jgi:hypothetical protein
MDLYNKRLDLTFLICLTFTLTIPVIFSDLRLLFLIPFQIVMYYQKPFIACLWGSLLCGTLVDLFSSYSRLGMCALTYTLTTCILYRQRENFFSDSLSTLPLMTFFFSVISTVIQLTFHFASDQTVVVTPLWALHDLIIMPVADGLYAFIVFILPSILFGKPRRKGKDYFLVK